MRIGVIGINHKLADLPLRDKLARTCQRRFSPDRSTHGSHSFVLLSTCNRTEIYFSSSDLPQTHTYLLGVLRNEVEGEFDQKFYSYFGYDCFLHLARVTAGLDSALVAETEIQGQVKDAYEMAATYMSLPSELHFLFQKALKVGKQVRGALPSKPGQPQIEHAIIAAGKKIFKDDLEPKILFVGASGINQKVLNLIKGRRYENITICNRTASKAEQLAEQYQVKTLPWQQLEEWSNFDWIICGTKSPKPIIKASHNFCSAKLIIDLSVPRNVDPDLNQCAVLNIDQLNSEIAEKRQFLAEALARAEELAIECSLRLLRERTLVKLPVKSQLQKT